MSYRFDPMHSQEYSSRSPGTTRQPYGMGTLNRQTSRQFTNYGGEQQNLSLFTSADHDRYEPSQFDRMTPQSHQPDYHYDSQTLNSQTWAYSAGNMNGGANTMGAGRMKTPSSRRAGLPSVSNFTSFQAVTRKASTDFS